MPTVGGVCEGGFLAYRGGVKRVRERRAEYLAEPENARKSHIERQRAKEDREAAADTARDRRERRRAMADAVSGEMDMLFSPGRKHVRERKEWVAVAKHDDREAGAGGGPIDLDNGVVELPQHRETEE